METPKDDTRNPASDERSRTDPVGTGRRLFAEVLGTFALTVVAAGGEVINAVSHGEVSAAARAVAPGLVVMAFIYTVGEVSGAHFNPAVTLAFAVRGVFPWRRVPAYWLAEFSGALLAAGLLRALFGNEAEVGSNRAEHGIGTALAMEILLTWLLVMVILGTACEKGLVGPNAALAVGATIALCGLFAAPISGASMNPARSLGPAIVARATSGQWIYLVGPAAGALVAVACTWLLHGFPSASEEEAARGKADGERGQTQQAVRSWRAVLR
jgi:aquaporin Z